jgi:hypothetical protein
VLTGPVVVGLGLFKYVAIGWSFLLSFNDARGTITLGTGSASATTRSCWATTPS